MVEHFYLGAYWSAREETVGACADRAVRWLARLREIDPAFLRCYEGGNSREEALSRPVAPDRPTILRLLGGDRLRKDRDRTTTPVTGFTFGLWNGGEEGESIGLMVSCGAYSKRFGNSCVIELPRGGEPANRILRVPALHELIAATVACWEPDHGVVTSHQCLNALNYPVGGIQVGWLVYLSAKYPVADPPPPVRVEPLGAGRLIVATEERFTAERPEHLEIACGIAECLGVSPSKH